MAEKKEEAIIITITGPDGDERDYAQLDETFTLYDSKGVKGGLTGTYVPGANRKAQPVVRTEKNIYFEDIKKAMEEGRNLAEERYDNLYQNIGKGRLRDVEDSLK